LGRAATPRNSRADAQFGIAVTVDCNNRYVLLDPYEGGKAVVAEAARKSRARAPGRWASTDCLNYGSPERPAVFYQFKGEAAAASPTRAGRSTRRSPRERLLLQ